MPLSVFLAVLAAALVHASWNALVKAGDDRLASVGIIGATQILISLALLPFVAPLASEAWIFVAISTVLSTAYMIALQRAYRAAISARSIRWRATRHRSSWRYSPS